MTTNDTLLKKLSFARLEILMKHPFLGYVLQHYNITLVDSIETAATNGRVIMFSRAFLKSLSIKDTIFVLLHELLHIILLHPARKDNRKHNKFNIACDIVVNDILKHMKFSYENLEPIHGEMFDLDGVLYSAEYIYDKLPIEEIPLICSHDFWDKDDKDIKPMTGKIKGIIKDYIGKGFSLDSHHLLERLVENHIFKPKTNWKDLLKRVIEKDLYDYSFNRTDRRNNEFLLPDFLETEETLKKVWFLIDVSGSMSNDEISRAYLEIISIIENYKTVCCEVSFFSTMVTTPIRFTTGKELKNAMAKIKSTGGTNFSILFDSLHLFYPNTKPKTMIILTDGYANYPDKSVARNMNVFWAINNNNKAPFGTTINIL